MTALMSWWRVDELKPYPWAGVPCPVCEETELARYVSLVATAGQIPGNPFTWFVCMACGELTTIEQRIAP